MKKFFKLMMTSLLLFSFLIPYTAFAEVGGTSAEWQDIELSEEEFNAILENNPANDIAPYTSGLILTYRIAIAKSGTSDLVIAGQTNCSTGVVRSGFSIVTVQRRTNSSSSWSTYKTYKDIYSESRVCNLSKTITIDKGYQYRVTCTHYAKKSFLSTEKINNTSNTVTF